MSTPIGRKIETGVRANFFFVNPSKMTGAIYVYHVHIYKVDVKGVVDSVDIASTEDTRITTSLLLQLKKKHPDWAAAKGYAYDNRSALFTTAKLPLPTKNDRNEPLLSEIVGITTNEGLLCQNNITNYHNDELSRGRITEEKILRQLD